MRYLGHVLTRGKGKAQPRPAVVVHQSRIRCLLRPQRDTTSEDISRSLPMQTLLLPGPQSGRGETSLQSDRNIKIPGSFAGTILAGRYRISTNDVLQRFNRDTACLAAGLLSGFYRSRPCDPGPRTVLKDGRSHKADESSSIRFLAERTRSERRICLELPNRRESIGLKPKR